MIDFLGVKSLDELIDQTVPAAIRLPEDTNFQHLGKTVVGFNSESQVLKKMTNLAGLNKIYKSYEG